MNVYSRLSPNNCHQQPLAEVRTNEHRPNKLFLLNNGTKVKLTYNNCPYFGKLIDVSRNRTAYNMEIQNLQFQTSHQQFYIADKCSPFRTDSDNFWTEEATSDRLAIEEGILGVGTECYGPVKGDLQVLEVEPTETGLDAYDHVVEGSLDVKSGVVQVVPCLEKTPVVEIKLVPRLYRIRIYSSNLDSVDDDAGDDYYRVIIWPADYRPRRVLKR